MTAYALTEVISELLGANVNERAVNAMVHCPLGIHEDKHPSFSINLDEGLWTCFSCQEKGNLKQLYHRLGERPPGDIKIYEAKRNAGTPEIFSRDFSGLAHDLRNALVEGHGRDRVKDFLERRGISADASRQFRLGYAKNHPAISFPYYDEEGHVTGIKYRYPSGFKASEDGSKYGLLNITDMVGKEKVIICEGESDTMRVWSTYGQTYGVGGTSGASISDAQWTSFGLKFLFASKVYLLYDADEAGDKAASNAIRVLGDEKYIRIRPPEGMDATDFLQSGHTLEEIGLE